MAGPRFREHKMPGWPGGMNNVFRADNVPRSQLREALNVDILERGDIRRRPGYVQRLALSQARSLYGFGNRLFCAHGSDLAVIDPADWTFSNAATVNPNTDISYTELNGELYAADENNVFRFDAGAQEQPFGTETPNGQPTLSALSLGTLPPGTYQVAITFERNGVESGAQLAQPIELEAEGSIQVSNIPQPAVADAIRIYLTMTSAEVLYSATSVATGTTSAVLSNLPSGRELSSQFKTPLPAGQVLSAFNGRLYSAVGSELFASDPLNFSLCDASYSHLSFAEPICMLRAVSAGLFVGLESSVVLLRGQDINEFSQSTVFSAGPIKGSDIAVHGGSIDLEGVPKDDYVVFWWSRSGMLCLGLPNGSVTTLREAELAVSEFEKGAAMLRKEDGATQLVSTLLGEKRQNRLVASDEVTATVIRNGI